MSRSADLNFPFTRIRSAVTGSLEKPMCRMFLSKFRGAVLSFQTKLCTSFSLKRRGRYNICSYVAVLHLSGSSRINDAKSEPGLEGGRLLYVGYNYSGQEVSSERTMKWNCTYLSAVKCNNSGYISSRYVHNAYLFGF